MYASQVVSGVQLTATTATYATCPANSYWIIQNMTLTNTTGGAVACTVYLVPQGGTAGAANTIISGRSVAAGATDRCPEFVGKVLLPGGSIQAKGLNVSLDVSAQVGP